MIKIEKKSEKGDELFQLFQASDHLSMSRRYFRPDNYQDLQTFTAENSKCGGSLHRVSSSSFNEVTQNSHDITFPWANPRVFQPPEVPGRGKLPEYFRSVSSSIPKNPDIAAILGFPLGLIISPGLVKPNSVIDCTKGGIIRCKKCSSYLSPRTQVSPDFRSFTCHICGEKNTVSNGPYNNEPLRNRDELRNEVYDMIAPNSYVALPHFQPVFLFIIDTSIPAIQSGFTGQFLRSLKEILPSVNEEICVHIITISNVVTVFDIENQKEFVFSDISDIPDLRMKPARIRENLSQILNIFDDLMHRQPSPNAIGHCLPSGLGVIEKLIFGKSGIVFVCCVNIPSIGPNSISPRNLNAEEITLLKLPQDGAFFREISFRLSKVSASYHIFTTLWNTNSIDLPAIGVPSGLTGGSAHFYKSFESEAAQELYFDLFYALTDEYYYKSSLRLRCSSGVKITKVHGNFLVQNRDLITFPVLSAGRAITYEFGIETEIKDSEVLFQAALLWTSVDNVTMLRVFNFTLPVTSELSILKSYIDEGALASLELKKAVFNVLSQGKDYATTGLRADLQALSTRNIPVNSMIHLYHSIFLSPLLHDNNGVDKRMENCLWIRSANITEILLYLYPRLYAIDFHNTELESCVLPLENNSFSSGSLFLFHTENHIYIWVAKTIPKDFIEAIFGVSEFHLIPKAIPQLNTPENQYIRNIMQLCFNLSRKYIPNQVIKQNDEEETKISHFLIDSFPNHDIKQFINSLSFLAVK